MEFDIIEEIAKAFGNKKFPACKIFVLNAQSDDDLAIRMITMFRKKGFLCWDNDCIIPGQNHNTEQEKAIYDADFIIAIFSAGSLKQEGRYAKLLTVAYDAQLEKQGGGIKLISVIVEKCNIPYEYTRYEPLDFTAPGNASGLVQSFVKEYARRQALGIIPQSPQAHWA